MKTPDLMELIQSRWYKALYLVVLFFRWLFIAVMTVYLAFCVLTLISTLFSHITSSGANFTFDYMRNFLTDALFVLVILDFVSAMFYQKRIHYVLCLLEIGFIVLMRKLILLNPAPENALLIFVLAAAVSLFFVLIFYFYKVTGRLRKP